MNYSRIISNEGYRVEDLSQEHQEIITWLKYLLEDFDGFEYADDDMLSDNLLGKIKTEFAEGVIDEVKDWIESKIMEYQINFAEQETDV